MKRYVNQIRQLISVSARPNTLAWNVKFQYALNVRFLLKTKNAMFVKASPFASDTQKRRESYLVPRVSHRARDRRDHGDEVVGKGRCCRSGQLHDAQRTDREKNKCQFERRRIWRSFNIPQHRLRRPFKAPFFSCSTPLHMLRSN